MARRLAVYRCCRRASRRLTSPWSCSSAGPGQLVAFVATRDPAAARRFYEEVVGLTLVSDDPFAVVFDSAGTTLRVTKVDQPTVAPYTVLGWEVDDIGAAASDLRARGATFEHFDGIEQSDDAVW